jgi:formyltetrahydrofolate-dependent phosphoribosylglycinamide formyltransferase
LLDRIDAGKLDAQVRVVISSRSDAYGLVRAQSHGIPAITVSSRKHRRSEEHSRALCAELRKYPVDLIAMAGFMCFFHIPPEYEGRVMNIHPALLPSFGGKRMYGHVVHEAVLEYGCKVSGCTVHFADNRYDHGPVILQRTCAVLDDDTPDTLRERVFREECEAYPQAIQLFAEGRLRIEGRRVRILGAGEER